MIGKILDNFSDFCMGYSAHAMGLAVSKQNEGFERTKEIKPEVEMSELSLLIAKKKGGEAVSIEDIKNYYADPETPANFENSIKKWQRRFLFARLGEIFRVLVVSFVPILVVWLSFSLDSFFLPVGIYHICNAFLKQIGLSRNEELTMFLQTQNGDIVRNIIEIEVKEGGTYVK